jgi:hypothetical protein
MLCIKLETLCPAIDVERIRKIYNKAVLDKGKESEGIQCNSNQFDSTLDLWINYLKWETEQGNHTRVHQLFWNAKHTLSNPGSFIARFSLLNNGIQITE